MNAFNDLQARYVHLRFIDVNPIPKMIFVLYYAERESHKDTSNYKL